MKNTGGFFSFFTQHSAKWLFWAPFFLALLWALANAPVMQTLWRHGFDDGTYSHGYLIPFIFIYLLIVMAKTGQLSARTGNYIPALVSAVLLVFAYFVALASQISLLVWVLSLALLANAYWMVFRFSWGMAYSVAFLLFMYPLWGSLQTALQQLSVFAVMNIMAYSGIPTYVEGTSVMIPAGTFVIAGGCSGLRYFLVSLAIGSLFVFLNLRRKSAIVKFLALAIIGALITNWIRIVALIVIGHESNMQSELMRDHNNFGWYIYAPFVVLLFWFGERLAKKEPVDPMTECKRSETDAFTSSAKKTMPAAVVLILVSSSALHLNLFSQSTNVADECQDVSVLGDAAPLLPYEARTCVKSVPVNGARVDTLLVWYNGDDLDGKPTQYQVRYFPEEWQVVRKDTQAGWNVVTAMEGQNIHKFAWRFVVDGEKTASVVEMKKLRLKKALKGVRGSALEWMHVECGSQCQSIGASWLEVEKDAF